MPPLHTRALLFAEQRSLLVAVGGVSVGHWDAPIDLREEVAQRPPREARARMQPFNELPDGPREDAIGQNDVRRVCPDVLDGVEKISEAPAGKHAGLVVREP